MSSESPAETLARLRRERNSRKESVRGSTDGTCAIEMMPLNARIMAIQNHHGEFEDFYFVPDRIEVAKPGDKYITLLAGGAGGYSSRGFNAEINIPCGTLVKWEIQ